MNIAVTGGSGFIGSWFLRLLPADVTAFVLTRSDNTNGLKFQSRIFELRHTDYSQASLESVLQGCDAVLHLAAARLVKTSNPITNVITDYNLFKACHLLGIQNVVFCSTRSVYGTQPNTPWLESQSVTPDNEYALAKVQSEVAAEYFNKQLNMAIKTLRISQVFGLGEFESSMVTTFLKRALFKQPLVVSVTGNIRREYIYVKDLVSALLIALKFSEKKGIYNLGSSWAYSIKELAEYTNKTAMNVHPVVTIDNPKELNEDSLMNNDKFYSEFDWMPEFTIQKALQDIFTDLKSTELKAEFDFATY